jgi:hypothetical protein
LYFAYRDKKVVGVFVRFRAPLQKFLVDAKMISGDAATHAASEP